MDGVGNGVDPGDGNGAGPGRGLGWLAWVAVGACVAGAVGLFVWLAVKRGGTFEVEGFVPGGWGQRWRCCSVVASRVSGIGFCEEMG